MSSGEESLDSGAPGGTKSRKDKNPAMWGLIGVLSGSLISGAFSLASARMQYEAAQNTAVRTQETNERSLEAARTQARNQFLRDQRVAVFKQYLVDSQGAEEAQMDYVSVLLSPEHTPEQLDAWYQEAALKQRQFVASTWGLHFFATEELKAVATDLTTELETRFEMVHTYSQQPGELEALETRVIKGADAMANLRHAFTEAASAIVSS